MQIKSEIPFPTKEKPFTFYKLDLNTTDNECLAKFKIDHQKNMFGILEDFEQSIDEVKQFIASLGNNDLESCAAMVELVFKIAHQVFDMFHQESAHILLRTFIPGEKYVSPYWHQDAYYFLPFSGEPLKAAIALIGDGTVFYRPDDAEFEEFKYLRKQKQRLSEIFEDPSKMTSTPENHGSVFIVGADAGAVHTVPYINSQRFFLSVLPGKKKDIQAYDFKQKLSHKMYKEGKSGEEIMEALRRLHAQDVEDRVNAPVLDNSL